LLRLCLVSCAFFFLHQLQKHRQQKRDENHEESGRQQDRHCQLRYLFLEVWPARQARNAASACSRSSALLNLRRGCFEGWTSIGVAPLTSSTPCRRMRLRPARRDQFTRPAITHFLATRAIQQSRRETMREDRRLCLSAPNDHLQDKSSGPSNRRATRGTRFVPERCQDGDAPGPRV